MISLDKIADALGHLVLTEDGAIISSGGDLENSEQVANIVFNLISLADKLGTEDGNYKKVSVVYKESSYIICLSNKKIYVLKKRFVSPPVNDSHEEELLNEH